MPNGTCWAGPEVYACLLTKSTGTCLSVTNSANDASQSSAPGEIAGPPTCNDASTSLTACALASYRRW